MFYVDDRFYINVDKQDDDNYRIKMTYKKDKSQTFMHFTESQARFVARELNQLLEKQDNPE